MSEHAAAHPEDKQAADAAAQTVLAMRQPVYTERDRVRAHFDQLLVDMKKDSPSNAKQAALLTRNTMRDMSARMKKGANRQDLRNMTPEVLVDIILEQLNMTDCPENIRPKMDQLVPRLREDLTEYFTLLEAAKEQIG